MEELMFYQKYNEKELILNVIFHIEFQLEKYVKNNKERRPCVVYGDSGCGKTSVLAKTATEVR